MPAPRQRSFCDPLQVSAEVWQAVVNAAFAQVERINVLVRSFGGPAEALIAETRRIEDGEAIHIRQAEAIRRVLVVRDAAGFLHHATARRVFGARGKPGFVISVRPEPIYKNVSGTTVVDQAGEVVDFLCLTNCFEIPVHATLTVFGRSMRLGGRWFDLAQAELLRDYALNNRITLKSAAETLFLADGRPAIYG